MTIATDDPYSASRLGFSGDRTVRSALFLATFLLIWLTAKPFPDLSDPKVLEPVGEGNFLGQTLALILTASMAAFVLLSDARLLLLKNLTPLLLLTLFWFSLSAAASAEPFLASRRLVLAAITIFQASTFLLLPADREHFGRLLAIGALAILALCYAGVVFAPELSIHQASDLQEPELAGDWRGAFGHKNGAGAAMAVLVFVGIFVFRSCSSILGALIVVLATVFLAFTRSKSPMWLLPCVFFMTPFILASRRAGIKAVFALGLPIIISVLTIGSVSSDAIGTMVHNLLSDPTFTGRNVIWRFTLDHIAQRPILGYGFQAFWGTSELKSAWSYLESWGYRASDAHNSYLNVAVMTGVVGLVLAMLWTLVQPLKDHLAVQRRGDGDSALNTMLMQAWLFGLCISGFESVLFDGGNVIWFMMLLATAGFRYQAIAKLTR
jgi:O-antigen ligase